MRLLCDDLVGGGGRLGRLRLELVQDVACALYDVPVDSLFGIPLSGVCRARRQARANKSCFRFDLPSAWPPSPGQSEVSSRELLQAQRFSSWLLNHKEGVRSTAVQLGLNANSELVSFLPTTSSAPTHARTLEPPSSKSLRSPCPSRPLTRSCRTPTHLPQQCAASLSPPLAS